MTEAHTITRLTFGRKPYLGQLYNAYNDTLVENTTIHRYENATFYENNTTIFRSKLETNQEVKEKLDIEVILENTYAEKLTKLQVEDDLKV
jgi:hypothetical protein